MYWGDYLSLRENVFGDFEALVACIGMKGHLVWCFWLLDNMTTWKLNLSKKRAQHAWCGCYKPVLKTASAVQITRDGEPHMSAMRGAAFVVNPQIKHWQKLAKPITLYTFLTVLGTGQGSTALVFFGSICKDQLETTKPKTATLGTWNSLFSSLSRRWFWSWSCKTVPYCYKCSFRSI